MLTEYEIKFREKLNSTFKELINFLDSNGLQWWAAYGTAIGAVRNKGMIPWDDDIDILMPRADYDKLLSIKHKLENYNILSLDDNGYYLPYAKFCDMRTTIWEVPEWPFLSRIWIDIFPLDFTNNTEKEIKAFSKIYNKKLSSYQKSIEKIDIKYIFSLLKEKHIKTAIAKMPYMMMGRTHRAKIKCNLLNYINTVASTRGNTAVNYCAGIYVSNFIYEAQWFDGYKLCDFEDYKVRIPIGYDKYLSYCYGNYMTPPPSDQQVTHHSQVYVNLNENITLDEVKERLKKGESRVY